LRKNDWLKGLSKSNQKCNAYITYPVLRDTYYERQKAGIAGLTVDSGKQQEDRKKEDDKDEGLSARVKNYTVAPYFFDGMISERKRERSDVNRYWYCR